MKHPNDNQYFYHIDPTTLVIPYDRDRNYNDLEHREDDGTPYLPPYSSYRYDSVYEGVILEIHVIDHCNLNCYSCNHFCPIAEPWYISPEELRAQLQAAHDNIPNIRFLLLIGGEPTLHPKLLELCKIAREIFPDYKKTDISVFSNGIKLEEVELNQAEYFNLRIGFSVCDYPGYTNETLMKKLIDNKVAHYCNNRVFMMQTLVDEKGEGNYINNYYNCSKHQLPCFTLRDYKLMICPFMEHSRQYFNKIGKEYPLTNDDYLDIRTINNNLDILQKYIFTPKQYCKYCAHFGEEHVWHLSNHETAEYSTEIDDLYFNDYNKYNELINNTREHFLACLNDDGYDMTRQDYAANQYQKNLIRHVNGKIDIIIPYYNLTREQVDELFNGLKSQTIINECIIYLISDNSPIEKYLYEKFKNSELKCIFLRTVDRSGPGAARNIGIDNSYNKYIFFMDADDKFVNNQVLERLYTDISNTKLLYHSFNIVSDETDQRKARKSGQIIDREVFNTYRIRFPNYFFGEDYYFLSLLNCCGYKTNKCFKYKNKNGKEDKLTTVEDNQFIHYCLKNNDNCLTHEAEKLSGSIIKYCLVLVNCLLADYYKTEFLSYSIFNELAEYIIRNYNEVINDKNEGDYYLIPFMYYSCYYIYQIYKYITLPNEWKNQFESNQIYLIVNNELLTSIDEIKSYMVSVIREMGLLEFFMTRNVTADFLRLLVREEKNANISN